MTKNGKNLARRATNLLVLFALILGTVVPSFAATQRRRTRRRATTARRVTTPPVRYFTVPADTVMRVRIDTEGTVTGKGIRKRDAVFIGGGAATGALIGAIAGGGKGAAIGAILSGGLGTGARVYEKEQDAEVRSGTEFGVILNRAVSLPEFRRQ